MIVQSDRLPASMGVNGTTVGTTAMGLPERGEYVAICWLSIDGRFAVGPLTVNFNQLLQL